MASRAKLSGRDLLQRGPHCGGPLGAVAQSRGAAAQAQGLRCRGGRMGSFHGFPWINGGFSQLRI